MQQEQSRRMQTRNRKGREREGGQERTRDKEEGVETDSVYCTESQGICMCSLFADKGKE